MGKEYKLEAQNREAGKEKAGLLIKSGFIPAVLYGSGGENVNLKIKLFDFERMFAQAGESSLIDLEVNGQKIKVVVKDVQKNALKGGFIHVDFFRVDMNKPITAEVKLEFTGEAKAVKELGGILVKQMDTVEMECLPGDLVDRIEVDLSALAALEDNIRLGDLKVPEKAKLIGDDNTVVANIAKPKVEEEAPVAEEASAEGAAEEKKEGEKEETKAQGNKKE